MIPTYNNGGTIADVVRKTLEACSDVIVVNDGSTDNTRQALEAIEGITLVTYDQNRGKGYALKQGFKKALELGFAYAITLDGDGQHYPENISLFLQANIDHPGALIIGSRNLDNVDRSKGSESGRHTDRLPPLPHQETELPLAAHLALRGRARVAGLRLVAWCRTGAHPHRGVLSAP